MSIESPAAWMSCAHNSCPGHIDLSGAAGRCTECSFHVATQGHRACCSQTAPIATEPGYKQDFLENMRRLKERRQVAESHDVPDQMWRYFGHEPPGGATAATATRSGPRKVAKPGANPAYVAAGIRRELDKLAAAHKGCRNTRLNEAAFAIFGFVKGGHAAQSAAINELTRIATANGLPASEIRTTLRSAWRTAEPRKVPAPRGAP